jgi:hypothetical protein
MKKFGPKNPLSYTPPICDAAIRALHSPGAQRLFLVSIFVGQATAAVLVSSPGGNASPVVSGDVL